MVQLFSKVSLAVNSRRTYASHHNSYLQFCLHVGHNPMEPITEQSLCECMILYAKNHKITTLPQFISAIANWHQEHELGELPRSRLFKRVQRGLLNVFGLTEENKPKAALTVEDLTVFYTKMLKSGEIFTFEGRRDWLCYIMAFFGLLRIHEYIGEKLKFEYVKVREWGLQIVVPFSKTNLRPVKVRLVKRNDFLCPVKAYKNYIALVPIQLQHDKLPFVLADNSRSVPLSDKDYIRSLRSKVQKWLHKDPQHYAGHSFRRGGTTAMFIAGVPETVVAAHGRWKSLAYRKYFDATVNVLLPTIILYQHYKPS
jgi:hypothetical protein